MDIDKNDHTHSEAKQGQKCCGCCCDMRRATIIVNALFIVFSIIDIITVLAFAGTARNSSDPNIKGEYDKIKKYIVGIIIVQILTLVFSGAAIFGAIKFTSGPVILNVVYMIISWIVSSIYTAKAGHQDSGYRVNIPVSIISSTIITCLFIYPQLMFVREVRAAVMTKETYAREKYSCCCV